MSTAATANIATIPASIITIPASIDTAPTPDDFFALTPPPMKANTARTKKCVGFTYRLAPEARACE